MAIKVLGGISTIKLGTCGAAGAMGATLVAVGKIVRDSINIIFDSPQKTSVPVEDLDDPLVVLVDPSVPKKFEFETHDYDAVVMAKFFGGTAVTGKWSAPTSYTALEQSVEITTKDIDGFHEVITIPRANVVASMNTKIVRNNLAALKIECEVLTPFDAGGIALSAIQFEHVAAS